MKLKKKKISSRPSFLEEKKLWKNGYEFVIGIDEVGRGAFAGPLVVGAVIFSENVNICNGINDSKLLTPQNREKLDKEIRKCAQFYSIAQVGLSVINKVGIGKATEVAFRKVISEILRKIPSLSNKESPYPRRLLNKKIFVLVDGFHIKYIRGIGLKNQKAIIKGDQKSISIAAASIIAKVYRDRIMVMLQKKYPHYHFDLNKGYGTKDHREQIRKYGLSKLHRKSFNLLKYNFP